MSLEWFFCMNLRIPAPLFSLEHTLNCGQVFHWRQADGIYRGTIGEQAVELQQAGDVLIVWRGEEQSVRNYFALDHDLAAITSSFPSDPAMRQAAEYCRGLRILRQPEWECVASFICSAQKQVHHISQISHAVRKRLGAEGAFPEPKQIAAAGVDVLRECAMGYRARHLHGAAVAVCEGSVDLQAIHSMDDESARRELMKLPGVGEKVANCVLLFAYERLRAFPVDVWIERILRGLYFRGKRKVTEERMRRFAATYFGPYGGYAQQYLFHYARKTWPRGGIPQELVDEY